MSINRRALIGSLAILSFDVLGAQGGTAQVASEGLPLPDRGNFESGDLLWPKKPGAYVPYRNTVGEPYPPWTEAERWLGERDAFLRSLQENRRHFSEKQIEELRSLSFREFHARYAGDQKPDIPGAYSTGGGIYVGHVGIIELDAAGRAWVVEALWEQGVVRNPYEKWLQMRFGEIVWHGRIRDISKGDRARVARESSKYVGKPYDFWNFDLNDDSNFYCSKLVWLSVWRALGFAIDGNQNPQRSFWFSPKQLLYASTISRLHDPGPYANR